jgi:hypothetical protein
MSNAVPLPAGSTLGKSFEYGLDINVGTTASPIWQPVRRISGFQPTPTPTTQDAQTYDDLGAQNSDVTGWSWNLAFNVQVNRSVTTGLYLPEIEALLSRTRPSAKGESAVVEVRWYHKPETGEPNPNDAGQGFATVSYSRQNTGPNGEIEQLSVTLAGKGPYTEIAHPVAGWDVASPTVTSVTPSGALTGDQVVITGTHLLGATAVTFDAIAADSFLIISATTIVAVLPADGAGPVDVIVTTPEGASPAFSYTRGA